VAGVPAVILFGFSSLIWILKKRHIRSIWILTLTSFFIAWITAILLTQSAPSGITISSWEPESILQSGLRYEIDNLSVPLVSASLALGLVIALNFEHSLHATKPIDLFAMCLLGGMGLLAIISANYITFSLSWVLWEIAIMFVQSSGDGSIFLSSVGQKRMLRRLISVPLTLAIAVILGGAGNDTVVISELAINWAFLLGIIIVIARMDFFQNPFSRSNDISGSQACLVWIHGISVASGFALLGQLTKYGSPGATNTIFVGLGFILCIVGILRLLVLNDMGSNFTSISLTILGVAVLLEPIGLVFEGEIVLLLSALMMLIFSTMSLSADKVLWSLIAVLIASSLIVGLPASIGAVVLNSIVETLLSRSGFFIGIISIISLIAIGLNIIRSPAMNLRIKKTSQEENNLIPILSTSFVLLTGLLMGLLHGSAFSSSSLGVFLILAGLLGVATYFIISKGISFTTSLDLMPPRWSLETLKRGWAGFSTIVGVSVQATARVFEGRAGLLWVYVIMQFILVAIGITE
jgi:hypothetical protein